MMIVTIIINLTKKFSNVVLFFEILSNVVLI